MRIYFSTTVYFSDVAVVILILYRPASLIATYALFESRRRSYVKMILCSVLFACCDVDLLGLSSQIYLADKIFKLHSGYLSLF